MNLNGDEKRIQQLFREMSRDDELRTPVFSRVVQGGSSRVAPFLGGASRSLALAFATLCVVVITLAIIAVRHRTPSAPDGRVTAQGPPTESQATTIPRVPDTVKPPRVVQDVKHVRRHRTSNELALAIKLSSWRSPTASLLKTSGDDKLMSLPRLGESLRTLRFYSLDELN